MALMQPYFFPYLGHFALISRVDRWVVFDTAQHIRRGWMNRNRILKPGGGWQYINVPTQRSPRDSLSKEIILAPGNQWKAKLIRQLQVYCGVAPNFDKTLELLESCLEVDELRLSLLNIQLISKICDALEIPFSPVFLSETLADPGACSTPGERVLQIASAMGASTYLNPAGGAHLLEESAFSDHGIQLEIQQYNPLIYDTGPLLFEPDLSVIDALMWNPWEDVRKHVFDGES